MERNGKRRRGPYKRTKYCEDFTPTVQSSDEVFLLEGNDGEVVLDYDCYAVERESPTQTPSTSKSVETQNKCRHNSDTSTVPRNTAILQHEQTGTESLVEAEADTLNFSVDDCTDPAQVTEEDVLYKGLDEEQQNGCKWVCQQIPNESEEHIESESDSESTMNEDFVPAVDNEEYLLYDSDVECDGEEDDNADTDLLYPGAHITIGAFMLLLAVFFTKHNIPGEGIQQLLHIIACALPNEHKLCTSLNGFKSFFQQLKNPIVKHYYCSYCLGFFGKEKRTVCPFPTCQKPHENIHEYFLEMPLETQLQSLYSQDGFYSSLQERFTRTSNKVADIYDDSLYKRYCENRGPLSNPDNISFTFNTDGASVFKSSNVSVWPLFLVINELPYRLRMKAENMILAGLWFGKKKPLMGSFLHPFQEVFKRLSEGIKLFCKEKGQFMCKAFLLCGTSDLPARSLLCNSVQYNGSFSCWKCVQKGETATSGKGHCHVFPFKENSPKQPERTQESVVEDAKKALDKLDRGEKQYTVNGIKGPSWLLFFPKFDVIQGIGIDYMHGVLLGVQKMMLNLWFSIVHKGKTFSFCEKVKEVDRRLLSICPTLNISRLPRSIQNDLKYWKASEYRSFLLYFGAPVLKGILDKERFLHYLCLVNAIHILLKEGCTELEISTAELMLTDFVKEFSNLYNNSFMTLNMHQVLHLADGVRTLGPLFTHSCFPFEDKNGVLLKMIKGTQNIDNQIITGVSFLKKIPELKFRTISKGTELEKLYISIEHPSVLSRGAKIHDNIYVLGAIKTTGLSDIENAAFCSYLGYDPILTECVQIFNRLEFYDDLIYGTTYTRMKKRDNSAISYLSNGEEKFGRVKKFVILQTEIEELYRNVYAIVEELQCRMYSSSNTCILNVAETGNTHAVPLQQITGSCMFVAFREESGSKCTHVCKFPNKLESD